jgi:thiamine pyrophosphate-dependent acetolactate synthase large subunit-like protein
MVPAVSNASALLATGAAYALLDAMPMILITGQKGILSSKQARFQIVDVVSSMTPLTKMARQISTTTIPSIVREAFRVAQQERPGLSCRRTSPERKRLTCCPCRRIRSKFRLPIRWR